MQQNASSNIGRRFFASGHGHHEPFEVPHYTTYNNWQTCPELVRHHQRLQSIGLKDPWIRNYAWEYNPMLRSNSGGRLLLKILFGGLNLGVIGAVSLIAGTQAYYYYKEQSSEGHGEHH